MDGASTQSGGVCVTNDIIEMWDESRALIEAVRTQKVALIGGFSGHIAHDKQIFSVLSHPKTKAFLNEEETCFIDETHPFYYFSRLCPLRP